MGYHHSIFHLDMTIYSCCRSWWLDFPGEHDTNNIYCAEDTPIVDSGMGKQDAEIEDNMDLAGY